MAKIPVYNCDAEPCKKSRGPDNGWFLYRNDFGTVTIKTWDDRIADDPGTKHLCSQACISRQLAADMEKVSH